MTTTPTAAARVSGTIKALEWEHVGTQPAGREYMTTCRTYKVTMWDDGSGNVLWFGQAGKPVRIEASTDEIGLAALQAAAQADYAARILAAIQPDPEPKPVAWRWRLKEREWGWEYQDDEPSSPNLFHFDVQPLYATPSSAGTVSVEAAARVRAWIAEWEKVRGRSTEIVHGLHAGTDREAVLLLADLRALAGEDGR